MRSKLSSLTLACLPLIACGGDSKAKVDSGVHLVDGKSIDAPPACTANASYSPTFGSNQQQATNHPATGSGSSATPHYQTWVGGMNADQDILDIELYAGFGAFTGGDIRTGTFPLTGMDAAYSTCGACVLIVTNVGSNSIGDFYMATGGSLTLTSVTGNLTGSLSNATFAHVGSAMGGPTDTAVGDCNSAVTAATINTPLVAGSAAFTGNGDLTTLGDIPVRIHHRYQ